MTSDLTSNCYISKVWAQDVDVVTPWEHAAVTNMISNYHLPIQSSSNPRHLMGKVSLRKTQPQISEGQGLSYRHKPVSSKCADFPQRIPQRQFVAFVALSR